MGLDNGERSRNGWNTNANEPWIIRPNETEIDRAEFERFWEDADVVLSGERLFEGMLKRVSGGKLCFYMSERWWKPPIGMFRLIHPLFLTMVMKFFLLSKSPYFHCLPIGPFAAKDLRIFRHLRGRMWSWGYFTDLPDVSRDRVISSSVDEPLKVLWVGRMLALKSVDLLIKAVANVQDGGGRISLTLIGDGPERRRLERLAESLLDAASYKIKNFVPHTEVPKIMQEHDVYVLPSNAYEGWGAVINEAMGAGCAVIASDMTGAGKAMIESSNNGFLFKSGSQADLARCLNLLVGDQKLLREISEQAIIDVSDFWSPNIAASRFLQVAEDVLAGRTSDRFSSGVMARL